VWEHSTVTHSHTAPTHRVRRYVRPLRRSRGQRRCVVKIATKNRLCAAHAAAAARWQRRVWRGGLASRVGLGKRAVVHVWRARTSRATHHNPGASSSAPKPSPAHKSAPATPTRANRPARSSRATRSFVGHVGARRAFNSALAVWVVNCRRPGRRGVR
jgi:hypothetical protein